MRYARFIIPILMSGLVAWMAACNKEEYLDNSQAELQFSVDTVMFDTIFSSIGSTTKRFVAINPHNKTIQIDRIALAKGSASNYRLNIDGYEGYSLRDYDIPAGDSIFIFVEVTIDPGKDEMIEQDSILFIRGNNSQDIDLVSFGQDVHLIKGQTLEKSITWTADKPFLIYNSVHVDSMACLTIDAGTELYFHRQSSMLVLGSLHVNGEFGAPVVFQGDRLEDAYSEVPGQWGAWISFDEGGIYLLGGVHFLAGSRNSSMNYAEIRNGIIGLRADSVVTPGTPTVALNNCKIENMNVAALYGAGAHITAKNCVFANAGEYTAALLYGGTYDFVHCSFANYWSGTRQTPQLLLNNYFTYESGEENIADVRPFEAYFGNCIVHGNLEEELLLDGIDEGGFEYQFDHCLLKTEALDIDDPQLTEPVLNEDPKFVSVYDEYDYHLDTLSAAMNMGDPDIATGVPNDLDGNSRLSDENPDLGAYERIE